MPHCSRPPEMTSSMAYSSATRIGFNSGTRLPNMEMRTRVVRCARIEPMTLQFDISP